MGPVECRYAYAVVASASLLLAAPAAAWGPYTHQAMARLQPSASGSNSPSFVLGASSPDAVKGTAPALHSLLFAAHFAAFTASPPPGSHLDPRAVDLSLGWGCHLAQDAVGHHVHGYLNPAEDHPLEFAVDTYVQHNKPGSGGGTLQKLDAPLTAAVVNASAAFAAATGTKGAELTTASAAKAVAAFDKLTSEEGVAIDVNFFYKSEMKKDDSCGAHSFGDALRNYELARQWCMQACGQWLRLMAARPPIAPAAAVANLTGYVDALFASHGGTVCTK